MMSIGLRIQSLQGSHQPIILGTCIVTYYCCLDVGPLAILGGQSITGSDLLRPLLCQNPWNLHRHPLLRPTALSSPNSVESIVWKFKLETIKYETKCTAIWRIFGAYLLKIQPHVIARRLS
jgi:hypothetical protein